jgi:hypothetical protein
VTYLLDSEILDYEDPLELEFSSEKQTPEEIEAFEIKNGDFYTVTCNLGKLVVKASHETLVARNIEIGLQQPTFRVSHGEYVEGERTLKMVLGLAEVIHDTVQAEVISGNIVNHYHAIDMPLVTYMGTVDSTDLK